MNLSTSRTLVVSNKDACLVRATISALDLTGLLAHAWGGGELGGLEPAPGDPRPHGTIGSIEVVSKIPACCGIRALATARIFETTSR